jgi:hypothetical protein
MPIIRADLAKARDYVKNFDWSASDALTDEDIARQVAEDPDVAPLPTGKEALSDEIRAHSRAAAPKAGRPAGRAGLSKLAP